ncbi:hypothetical protein [Amycolatopsis jejuensis]|uniref:hypothetical protein n=1 Tax=Amycolatopsis jejuensis TaxID=330084 RepID=UPI000AA97D5D|nr:hypothetical protein [Amycolatopsis jejuensis]
MTTAVQVSIREVLARLDDIHPLLQAEAEDSERLRRPTPAVQDAVKDSGVLALMIPAELGGLEATPLRILEVIEKLSHSDASLGWLVRALAAETAAAATYLSDEAVAELFADGAFPLVAGQSTGTTGHAVRGPGGLRVSGSWQFAPGVSMATHLTVPVTVDGSGERLTCLVPRSRLQISDNWDMLGLRATASLDYTADEVAVDGGYIVRIGPDNARRGGVVNRLSPALLSGLNQAAWSQGVGRRLLDELAPAGSAQGGHYGLAARWGRVLRRVRSALLSRPRHPGTAHADVAGQRESSPGTGATERRTRDDDPPRVQPGHADVPRDQPSHAPLRRGTGDAQRTLQ